MPGGRRVRYEDNCRIQSCSDNGADTDVLLLKSAAMPGMGEKLKTEFEKMELPGKDSQLSFSYQILRLHILKQFQ